MPDVIPIPKLKLSPRQALARFEDQVKDAVRTRWTYLTSDPIRRKKTMRAIKFGSPVLVLLLAGLGWWIFGPRLQPNYDSAPIDDVFDYTLLSDEFNRLPVEERLKLIGKLVQRLKGMSADDSVLLAAFAAGIGGAARQQLEENGSRLAIDLWDSYAKDYDKVPPDKREDFLEQKFVEFTKTMEDVAGQPRDISDSERINEGKQQAQKDMKFVKDHPDKMPDGQTLGRVFGFMNSNVASHASPEQKQRGQLLMRDMVREFRGQDVSTGKWKNGPP
jgi:hypothetical protein